MISRGVGALASVAALVACVPATVDEDPRGAIGVKLVPSAASRGEPFTTSDGWTLRVTRFAYMLDVRAADVRQREVYGVSAPGSLFAPASSESLAIVRAVPVGEYSAIVAFPYRSFVEGVCQYCPTPDDDRSDAEMKARFSAPADGATADGCYVDDNGVKFDCLLPGPTIWIVGEATRGAARISFDIAFDGFAYFPDRAASRPVRIRQDDIVMTELVVAVEKLFTHKDVVAFDDFAAGDLNQDGVLTAIELYEAEDPRWVEEREETIDDFADERPDEGSAAPRPAGPEDELETYEENMYNTLRGRAGRIFVAP